MLPFSQPSASAGDEEICTLLHHLNQAHRYWVALIRGEPFVREEESKMPESLDGIKARFQDVHARQMDWVSSAQESDLARSVETPFLPGSSFSVTQALMQVCLHSQGHRAQCAIRLRALGGTPPATDFILWLKDRAAADWS